MDGQASDEETGLLGNPAPAQAERAEPEGLVAVSMALSAEIFAELLACAVIKVIDVVECQGCDRPTVRSRLHGSFSGPTLPVIYTPLFCPIATHWGSKSSELTR